MKQAYVTLLSSHNYLKAVIALNQNLIDLNSQYSLLVMVTENIAQQVIPYLQKEKILYQVVNYLNYSTITQKRFKDSYILNIASKLNVFLLKEYDKVVYIDADSFFLTNIDELFNYPDGAMYAEPGCNYGFAGMFVCCPKNHMLEYYIAIIEKFDIWESDLLGALWFPFKTNKDYRIPFQYFVNITLQNLDTYDLTSIKGIHFCYKYKPWNYNDVSEFLQDFNKEFVKHSNHNRFIYVGYYIQKYLIPIQNKYPELQRSGSSSSSSAS